jgi:hypothetical protein
VRIEQNRWTPAGGWRPEAPGALADAELVLVFGGRAALAAPAPLAQVRHAYPRALFSGCSTAGEICGTEVTDDALAVTAIRWDGSRARGASVMLREAGDSAGAGRLLAERLEPEGLVHVLLLADGLHVNGSELVRGFAAGPLPAGVPVTGGLAGDGARFEKTLVFHHGAPEEGAIAAIGLYGQRLRVGYGSLGGWDPFGTERLITRARGNILYELDGTPALELYKRYLGEHASGLPASGLLFPLSVRTSEGEPPVVRTILAVDEREKSITFAGDIPEGAYARLMKANFSRLVEGAAGAARDAAGRCLEATDLAILISCVGRKLLLKQRTEEEVESVREVVGERAVLAGFYSYGEIAPTVPAARCELHNQTMTITAIAER